ncbi:MAG: hypothetical protein KDM91_18270 [Verrucomicrobiae bacterium]|nr:hypothetical protein [Verrucomicrobiae bacterium]
MRIQAIAALFTAATVSFFQMQKEGTDALPRPSEVSAEAASISAETTPIPAFAWEVVKEDRARVMQVVETPAATETEGAHAATPAPATVPAPATGTLKERLVDLAESGEAEVIDLENEPVMVDLANPTPASALDAVVETREPGMVVKTISASTVGEIEKGVTTLSPGLAAVEETEEDDAVPAVEVSPVPLAMEPAAETEKKAPGKSSFAWEAGANTAVAAADGVEEKTETAAPAGVADRLVQRVTQAVTGQQPQEEVPAEPQPTMGEEEQGGFWLRGAKLNDVFQYLARAGNRQYFHNVELEAPNYVVTGHLSDGDPLQQMEELGLMYGVTVHQKGNTIYAMTESQLAQLPTKPLQYHLRYLRPGDIEQIKAMVQPIMTPGRGTVDYESKTNTLILIDNEQRLDQVKEILNELDQPKQQIAIETRILRIKSSSRNRIGVDWSTVLGDGLSVQGTEALNALFNLPESDIVNEVVTMATTTSGSNTFTIADKNSKPIFSPTTGSTEYSVEKTREQDVTRNGSHLVMSPLQLQATLRALQTGGLAQQESSPTLVTEDNEPGIISVIDRVPIITATISQTDAGQNITEEVRYLIDQSDPSASDDPENSREIGVTVAVLPTILPDDTIRLDLRPRSSQIVEFIEGRTGNLYPRVNESTVDTIARVPNGHSLLIGGFYEDSQSEESNKVPILGDVPGVNFLFKSTDNAKEMTSLVFVVTPKLYTPVSLMENDTMTMDLHQRHVLPENHAWPDRRNPGSNYEPNLGRNVGNAFNLIPADPPANPLHPEHPVNQPEWVDSTGPAQYSEEIETPAGAVLPVQEKRGLFGNIFKKHHR